VIFSAPLLTATTKRGASQGCCGIARLARVPRIADCLNWIGPIRAELDRSDPR